MPEGITDRKFCKRCLLSQIPEEGELQKNLQERIDLLPPEERADEQTRALRLRICLACDMLNRGTCGLCGCYVELRAAKVKMACPHVPKKW